MSLLRRLTVVSLSALALMATTVLGSSTAFARVDHDGVYALPYRDTLIEADPGCNCFYELDHAGWAQLGFPTPRSSDTDFVKYPWSSTIYAVTYFGPERSDWYWSQITYAEWTRAGRPVARNAGWVQGSRFYRYELNDDIFVIAPDGSIHLLTSAEWRAAGSPAPEVHENSGYVKLSWSSEIVYLGDARMGYGYPVSYREWRDTGFPTPRTVSRIAHDEVYGYRNNPTLYYRGGGIDRIITRAEWQRMGSPKPVIY